MDSNEVVWVCTKNGKLSHDRFGINPISQDWDEFCISNCEPFRRYQLELNQTRDLVVTIKPRHPGDDEILGITEAL